MKGYYDYYSRCPPFCGRLCFFTCLLACETAVAPSPTHASTLLREGRQAKANKAIITLCVGSGRSSCTFPSTPHQGRKQASYFPSLGPTLARKNSVRARRRVFSSTSCLPVVCLSSGDDDFDGCQQPLFFPALFLVYIFYGAPTLQQRGRIRI